MEKVLFISSNIKKLEDFQKAFRLSINGEYLILSSNSLLDENGAFIPECIVIYVEEMKRQQLFPIMDLREDERFRDVPLLLISDESDRELFRANVKPGPEMNLPPYTGLEGIKKSIMKLIQVSAPMKHVLIVDDDVIALKVVKGYLDKLFRVTCVKTGMQALRFLERQLPDCILLDCFMPEMDGPTTLAKIREMERDKNTPVIFLTGNSEREMVMNCVSLHPSGFLLKPVNQGELIRKLQEIM